MNSAIIEIPILMRWKVSKEEIRNAIEEKKDIKKTSIVKGYPDIIYGLCINKSNNKFGISFGFLMKESRTINGSFKFAILSNNKVRMCEQKVFKNNQTHGRTFCSWEKLFNPANNYFIDDYMYITLEGIFSFEDEQDQEMSRFSEIESLNNLGELLWNRDDQDFDICFNDGKILKVHKLIISAKSSVFDRMLQSGLKETKEGKVSITDFEFDTVEIAMKYCYGIPITEFLNVQIGIKLLQFSDKYDVSDLKNSMKEYLFQQKSPVNVCEIVNASILVNSIKLREQCFDFMLDCMKESIFIKDLEILDKEFSLNLLKASFTCFRA